MARFVKLILKAVRLKLTLWAFVCGLILFILTKTSPPLMFFDSHVAQSRLQPIGKVTFSSPDTDSAEITTGGCSKDVHLGVPRYVSDACSLKNSSTCATFTCANLLSGVDRTVYQNAREYMKAHVRRKVEPRDFVRMTENCERFRVERGYARKSLLEAGEEDFPIAFNIIAHGNVEQVERLIYALYRPRNRFCVHFDLKSTNGSQEALEAIGRCLPNVFSASKRIAVYWGSFTRLEADIQCMQDHAATGKDWRYLANTAGQAFPLRSVKEMVAILKLYNGSNDLEGIYGGRVIRHRFEYKFVVRDGIIAMKEPNERHPDPPHEIDIVRGSAYGLFSRAFVEFVLTDRRAKDFLEWSRDTFSPDELYFSTLHHVYSNPHLRTPGGYSGDRHDKHSIDVPMS